MPNEAAVAENYFRKKKEGGRRPKKRSAKKAEEATYDSSVVIKRLSPEPSPKLTLEPFYVLTPAFRSTEK